MERKRKTPKEDVLISEGQKKGKLSMTTFPLMSLPK